MHQRAPYADNLIGTVRRPDAAAANGDAAIHLAFGHRLRQRDHEVRVVVAVEFNSVAPKSTTS